MREGTPNLGDAELEVMKAVWKAEKPVSATEIGRAVAEKNWKRTTIATFLARLVEKGALTVEQRGRFLYYTARLSAGEYKKAQVKHFVKRLFDGSARDLVAALFDEELSSEDVEELRAIFEEKEE